MKDKFIRFLCNIGFHHYVVSNPKYKAGFREKCHLCGNIKK